MRNLIFRFLTLIVFFGCEDEEASNVTSDLSLVGNYDVNLEILREALDAMVLQMNLYLEH